MAYQSSDILFGHPKGGKFILVRLEGTTPRGHGGGTAELTQRAKVGYCSCCTYATDVAAPATNVAGEFSNVKARGLELCGLSYAASRYADYLYLQDHVLVRKCGIGQRGSCIWRLSRFLLR